MFIIIIPLVTFLWWAISREKMPQKKKVYFSKLISPWNQNNLQESERVPLLKI